MTGINTLALILATVACGTSSGAQLAESPSGRMQGNPTPQVQDRNPRYVIQREDVLKMTFPLSPELNQTLTVEPDGYVNLQNAGSVFAQGLTSAELVLAVRKAYVGVLHDPIINIDIVDFQKPFFTVSGQVGKPGQYELRADTTITEGLAIAGGMAPTAKGQVFLLRRGPASGYEVRRINVGAMVVGKKANEIPALRPGDIVYVPEKFIANFRKYAPYAITSGTYANSVPF